MIMCLQKDTDDQGRYIPAKSISLKDKFQSVVDWFDGKITKNDVDDSIEEHVLSSTRMSIQNLN